MLSFATAVTSFAPNTGEVIRNQTLWAEMEQGLHEKMTQIYTPLSELPATFTWADYKGTNYLTTLRNQVGAAPAQPHQPIPPS